MAGMLDDAMSVLGSLFEMPGPRLGKCKALYNLAKEAHGGCIVELGTYHGNGAIALALGTRDGHNLPVYTIDDYRERKGWANEPYSPDDEAVFHHNVVRAKVEVNLVRWNARNATAMWEEKIALLHWDLGIFSSMKEDLEKWAPHVVGVVVVHDTFDQRLGSRDLDGWRKTGHFGGGIWVFRR